MNQFKIGIGFNSDGDPSVKEREKVFVDFLLNANIFGDIQSITTTFDVDAERDFDIVDQNNTFVKQYNENHVRIFLLRASSTLTRKFKLNVLDSGLVPDALFISNSSTADDPIIQSTAQIHRLLNNDSDLLIQTKRIIDGWRSGYAQPITNLVMCFQSNDLFSLQAKQSLIEVYFNQDAQPPLNIYTIDLLPFDLQLKLENLTRPKINVTESDPTTSDLSSVVLNEQTKEIEEIPEEEYKQRFPIPATRPVPVPSQITVENTLVLVYTVDAIPFISGLENNLSPYQFFSGDPFAYIQLTPELNQKLANFEFYVTFSQPLVDGVYPYEQSIADESPTPFLTNFYDGLNLSHQAIKFYDPINSPKGHVDYFVNLNFRKFGVFNQTHEVLTTRVLVIRANYLPDPQQLEYIWLQGYTQFAQPARLETIPDNQRQSAEETSNNFATSLAAGGVQATFFPNLLAASVNSGAQVSNTLAGGGVNLQVQAVVANKVGNVTSNVVSQVVGVSQQAVVVAGSSGAQNVVTGVGLNPSVVSGQVVAQLYDNTVGVSSGAVVSASSAVAQSVFNGVSQDALPLVAEVAYVINQVLGIGASVNQSSGVVTSVSVEDASVLGGVQGGVLYDNLLTDDSVVGQKLDADLAQKLAGQAGVNSGLTYSQGFNVLSSSIVAVSTVISLYRELSVDETDAVNAVSVTLQRIFGNLLVATNAAIVLREMIQNQSLANLINDFVNNIIETGSDIVSVVENNQVVQIAQLLNTEALFNAQLMVVKEDKFVSVKEYGGETVIGYIWTYPFIDDLKPVYRLFNAQVSDHCLVTTDQQIIEKLQQGYLFERIVGYIRKTSTERDDCPGPVLPLYEALLKQDAIWDHYYTTSQSELDALPPTYQRLGIIGYLSEQPKLGTLSFYRLFNETKINHIVTESKDELNNLLWNAPIPSRQFAFQNVQLLGWLPLDYIGADGVSVTGLSTNIAQDRQGNDCWGWTDPETGHEYAIMGLTNGTTFVDVTNPSRPRFMGLLPTHTVESIWFDVKVYQNYAFIVSEANDHGMQVFDLTRLRHQKCPLLYDEDAHYDQFVSAHNIWIVEDTGFAYILGIDRLLDNAGLHIVDIKDPLNPTFVTNFKTTIETVYSHDAYGVVYKGPDLRFVGHEIIFGFNENWIVCYDVTEKQNIKVLSIVTYEGHGYIHQGCLTVDQRYLVSTDESDEATKDINTALYFWDYHDLTKPVLIARYDGPTTAIDHNIYIVRPTADQCDKAFLANYSRGLVVIDIYKSIRFAQTNQFIKGREVDLGFLDTYPEDNLTGAITSVDDVDDSDDVPSRNAKHVAPVDLSHQQLHQLGNESTFKGAWSCYPYFHSDNVLVSDIHRGLFMTKFDPSVQSGVTYAKHGPCFSTTLPQFSLINWSADNGTFSFTYNIDGWTFGGNDQKHTHLYVDGNKVGRVFTTVGVEVQNVLDGFAHLVQIRLARMVGLENDGLNHRHEHREIYFADDQKLISFNLVIQGTSAQNTFVTALENVSSPISNQPLDVCQKVDF